MPFHCFTIGEAQLNSVSVVASLLPHSERGLFQSVISAEKIAGSFEVNHRCRFQIGLDFTAVNHRAFSCYVLAVDQATKDVLWELKNKITN